MGRECSNLVNPASKEQLYREIMKGLKMAGEGRGVIPSETMVDTGMGASSSKA